MNAIDPFHFRQVMGQYPTGVTVITATAPDGEALGMVVGTFSSVSLDPPLVTFMPTRGAGAWRAIQESGDRFCVNILSEAQDDVCRAVASRWTNRFDGIPYSLSPGGQPVIHGAAAYIECTIERTVEAGDHDIVLGRVRSMDVLNSAYPLLFFRGGYGAFQPQTLTTKDATVREDLRSVTPCRGVMERLAEEMNSQVTVLLRDIDEVVLAAAAGQSEAATVPTRVGQRFPFAPPMGSLDAALNGGDAEERWLAASPTNGGTREGSLQMLQRVRERGYAIAFGHEAHERVEQISAQLARRDPTVDEESLHVALGEFARSYNRDLAPGEQVELRYVNAPVFHPDGALAFGLTLWGPAGSIDAGEVERHVDRLLEAATECTRILAEHPVDQHRRGPVRLVRAQ